MNIKFILRSLLLLAHTAITLLTIAILFAIGTVIGGAILISLMLVGFLLWHIDDYAYHYTQYRERKRQRRIVIIKKK